MTTMPGNDADRTPPHTTGSMLATWLAREPGRELSGIVQEVTDRNGTITSLGPSHSYCIGAVIGQGGQAAVAAATPVGAPDRGPLVARVELNPRDPRDWRRRELLLFLGHLSRVTPATYPALIRVTESFVTYAHSSDLHGQPRFDSHAGNEPLWVDVMERCTTLADHLRDTHPNGYDPLEGAKLAVPLLRTLGVLHDHFRLVHRDIDEGNVLVAPDATLRIADWGVVVPMSGAKDYTYTVTFGKHATMPPENRDGDQKVGHHTDAWQAGRLLGLILTGASPFLNDGTTLNSPRLNALPRELRTIIEGLTNPHIGARLGTYDAATLLEKYIGYPVTPPIPPREGRRRKALVGVAALALVAGAGTIAALNWPAGESNAEHSPTSNTPTAVQPVAVTDGNLRVIASPSGVVCDLGAAEDRNDLPPDAKYAECYVPFPSYPAFGDDALTDVTCREALRADLLYESDLWLGGCVAREEHDAVVLAAGSTNTYGGHICTVEEDVIECVMDDGSGFGFRIGNSEFKSFQHQRMLSLAYTNGVYLGTPVWELSWEGANPITLPPLAQFFGFDPQARRVLHSTAGSVSWSGGGVGPSNLAAGDLVITDLDDNTVEMVLPGDVVEARWAPGNADIAYIVGTLDTYELRWRSVDGEDRLLARDVSPTWSISPRGDAVAFTRQPEYGVSDDAGLFVVSVSDATEVKVSHVDKSGHGSVYDEPVWSPDGEWVTLQYYNDETSRYLISLARTDGTAARDLQLSSSLSAEPWATTCFLEPFYWSPTGDQIIGQSCFVEAESAPNPLIAFQIDPESATISSGELVADIGSLIGWDIPGDSVWVYPTNSRTPEQLKLP